MYLSTPYMADEARNRKLAGSKARAAWTFFRQWLRHPHHTAAVAPSGLRLARKMVSELPPSTMRIIELGGGTGVFTRALLEHGVAPADLLVLELNNAFCRHLRTEFPRVRVAQGDARELQAIATKEGFLKWGRPDAVISGLGLLSMTRETKVKILGEAFSVLKPEGRYIQFTYGPRSPVSHDLLAELGLSVRRGGFALWNAPPATVYVYTRND